MATLSFALILMAFILSPWRIFSPWVARLRRERRWLEAIAGQGADGLVVLDKTGVLLAGNEAFCRMLDLSWGNLAGLPFRELVERDESGEEGAGEGVGTGRRELRLRRGAGRSVEVELNSAEFGYEDREFLLVSIRDMGRIRKRERETLRVGERERLLLGKELHDGLGQHLTGVAFMAKTLARNLVGKEGRGAETAEEIGELLRDAVGQIRILVKGLELSEYEARDLPGALREMSEVVGRLMGCRMEVDLPEGMEEGTVPLSRTEATQLYRICHDVVSEAVRTHMAQKIQVRLRESDGVARLVIRYDGSPPRRQDRSDSSEPAYRLRYRARLMDADLDVQVSPEGGSTTTCSFRLSRE
jgi:PAS domain S-box-containing protein